LATKALVWPLIIVKLKIDLQGFAKLFNGLVLVELHFFDLTLRHRRLDKDIIHGTPLAVHADFNIMSFEGAGKLIAGIVGTLVRIQYSGFVITSQSTLQD
jgi:hypothetical protein